jgi:hypothetical protein
MNNNNKNGKTTDIQPRKPSIKERVDDFEPNEKKKITNNIANGGGGDIRHIYKFKEGEKDMNGETMKDGRGRYQVRYTKGKDIGEQRFGNKNVAVKFANGMKKKGYDVKTTDLESRKPFIKENKTKNEGKGYSSRVQSLNEHLSPTTLNEDHLDKGDKINFGDVVYKAPHKDGSRTFVIMHRAGKKDPWDMYEVDKSGKVLKDWGNHPSLDGAKKMGKKLGFR